MSDRSFAMIWTGAVCGPGWLKLKRVEACRYGIHIPLLFESDMITFSVSNHCSKRPFLWVVHRVRSCNDRGCVLSPTSPSENRKVKPSHVHYLLIQESRPWVLWISDVKVAQNRTVDSIFAAEAARLPGRWDHEI